jgi:hypothetical protein
VQKWLVPCETPNARWTHSIDGYELVYLPNRGGYNGLSRRAEKALMLAYPMPTTITEAWAEYSYWERRRREIGLAMNVTEAIPFDAVATIRHLMVTHQLQSRLQATSLEELILRVKLYGQWENRSSGDDVIYRSRIILDNLEHLCHAEKNKTVVDYPTFRAAQKQQPQPKKAQKRRDDPKQTAFGF